jgi:prepilin-type processing-associated H-X9-DG protein
MPHLPSTLQGRVVGASAVLLAVGCLTSLISPVFSHGIDRNQQCVFNLAQIAHGVQTYAQDYDERLPQPIAFSSIANFKSLVGYYVTGKNPSSNDSAYRCPANGNAYYTLNAALGGTQLTEFPDPYVVEVARDSKPHPDGYPNIGFLDGHIERNGVDQMPTDVACRENAHSIALALSEYIQDYDEHYPFQTNDDMFRQSLQPYTRSLRIFFCPDTRQPYNIAQSFRGKTRAEIPDLSKVILLQDAVPHKNGIVTTAYLSGYVEQRGPNGALLPPPLSSNPVLTGQQISLSNFKQIGSALMQYTQDYDERLPVYSNYAELLPLLTPYLNGYDQYGSVQRFDQPTYQADPIFSGVQTASIPNVSSAIYLRDVYDFGDRMITVGYLDGHAKRIPAPPKPKARAQFGSGKVSK